MHWSHAISGIISRVSGATKRKIFFESANPTKLMKIEQLTSIKD
jgi:hypothetical protein